MAYVTLDVETPYSKQYSLKRLTYEAYIRDERFRVNGLGYKINNEPVNYVYGDSAIRETLTELFPPGNDHILIAHNTLFDGAVLAWLYNVYPRAYWCTESLSRVLWNQRSASLEQLAISCFPDDEDMRKGVELENFEGILRELDDGEQEVLGDYCCNDVELTWACLQHMYRWVPDETFRIMDIVLRMFIRPVFVLDQPRVESYLEELEHEKERVIEASGLSQDVLASNDQFAQWILDQGILFEKVASPTPKNPENEKWPLAQTEPAYINVQAQYPEYGHVWEARRLIKSTIERTRAKRMLDHAKVSHINPDGLLALPCKVSGAHTHRLSGTNKINPQNFKRGNELRKSLVAPESHVVLVGDLSNIELRMCAWLAGETDVLAHIAAGIDLYCEFASYVFNRPITKEDFVERFVGKVCELSLQYMVGWRKLQRTLATGSMGGPRLQYSERDCRLFVKTYRDRRSKTTELWREADDWLEHMTKRKAAPITYKCLMIEYQRIRLPNGVYLNYPELSAEVNRMQDGWDFTYFNGKYHKSIYGAMLVENIVQAISQVVLRHQMIEFEDYLQTIGGRIGLQVHDEIVAVVPEIHAEDAQERLVTTMRTVPDWCHSDNLVFDAEVGYAREYSK